LEKLQSLADEWIEKLTQFGELYAVARPRALLLRGQLDMLTGKQRHGLRSFHRSLQAATRLGMGYDRALALLELGRHASDLSHARRYLGIALDLLDKAGALYDYARCERVSRAWERAALGEEHADDLLGEPPDLPGFAGEEPAHTLARVSSGGGGTPPPNWLRRSIPSPSPGSPIAASRNSARNSSGMSPLPTNRSPRRSPPKRSSTNFIFRGSAASASPIGIKDRSLPPNGAVSSPLKMPGSDTAKAGHRRAPPPSPLLHAPVPNRAGDPQSPVDHRTVALSCLPPASPADGRPPPLVRQRTPDASAVEMAAFAVAASRENSFRFSEQMIRADSRSGPGAASPREVQRSSSAREASSFYSRPSDGVRPADVGGRSDVHSRSDAPKRERSVEAASPREAIQEKGPCLTQ
jgi:hypothetical protein